MDVHSKELRSKNMKAIHSKNTKMEVKLAKALWERGYRFRRNSKYVFGKPDFSLKKLKLAIFVDSEFFHGKDWEKRKFQIKSNREYWWAKIENNKIRDVLVKTQLESNGWKVLRFWAKEVEKEIDSCLNKIEDAIYEIRIGKDDTIPKNI